MNDLITVFHLPDGALSWLTSAVQFGFIVGTLMYALFAIADRHSPSKVFFVSALLGALVNVLSIFQFNTIETLIGERFLTGFFLAGIYPIGIKIASDYFDKGLGKSLGYLVGALVLGTAFPHLLKSTGSSLPWEAIILGTSCFAIAGGVFIRLFVPDGPHRKKGQKFTFTAIRKIFSNPSFRSASFGYFGHMWELYTFWAFLPLIIEFYLSSTHDIVNYSLWSFIIISCGALACITGGYLSLKYGPQKIANIALFGSGLCCCLSPLLIAQESLVLFIIFMIIWGMLVITDSPLFSTLVAKSATPELKGSAITLVNCIGFSITIVSIQTMNYILQHISIKYALVLLAIGPALGLFQILYHRTKKH